MDKREISPQEYNSDRKLRRELQRQAKKEGRELPDRLPEKVKLVTLCDKELWNQAIKILESNNIPVEKFINISLSQIINAQKDVESAKGKRTPIKGS